jgi:RNA polymerase-binding transcription factor DksA
MVINFKTLRSRLEQERKRLIEEFEQLNVNNRSITLERREGGPYGKREEEASGALDLEKRVALQSRERDALAQVEHALYKFDRGTYGLCDSCGESIDPARLEALPQATRCVNCAGRIDKTGR